MSFRPTEEQEAIRAAFGDGLNVVVDAGAGSGKTSTLKMGAEALSGKRVFYGAFNRSIAQDAAVAFPEHVTCKTIHSLAFGQVGRLYKQRLNSPRQPARQVAHILGIKESLALGEVELYPATIARLAVETVDRFCNSADDQVGWRHVPRVNGLDGDREMSAVVKRLVLPYAVKIWDDLQSTDEDGGGLFKFGHGHYRKIFALRKPTLPYDVILLDEAQDTAPVVAELMLNQPHAQRIVVGDRAQAIYQWAGGAMATIDEFDADARLRLTRSFRFGAEIAAEGNKWLAMLEDCDMRITGTGHSVVGPCQRADAVLTRTNGGAAAEVLSAQKARRRVALVGGGDDIRRLAQACEDMRAGRRTSHPELVAFKTWSEVQDYAEHDSSGSDLKAFVRLVDRHGPDVVIEAMDRLDTEKRAQLTVSTAHKAKGREWAAVRIGSDFEEPTDADGEPTDPSPEEVRLAYVAVTRAQHHLDPGGLDWINKRAARQAAAGVSS